MSCAFGYLASISCHVLMHFLLQESWLTQMYGEALSHLQQGQFVEAQMLFQAILEDPISLKAQVVNTLTMLMCLLCIPLQEMSMRSSLLLLMFDVLFYAFRLRTQLALAQCFN